MEGMEQRKQMMAMWAGAVENLRQRDTDIRHIREVGTVCERIQCHSLEDFDYFFILQTRKIAPFGAEPQGRNISSPSVNLSQQRPGWPRPFTTANRCLGARESAFAP